MEQHQPVNTTINSVLQPAFFEAVLSAMADYVYAFNRQRRFAYANKTMQSLFGNTSILGKTLEELNYPPHLARHLNGHIDQVFETGKLVEDEVFFDSPSGKSAWFNYSWTPLFGTDGSVELVIGVSRDVTERHMLENKLRESGLNYRTRLETEVHERNIEQKRIKDLLQATMDSSLEMIQVFKAVRNHQNEIVDFEWVLNNSTAEAFYGNVIGKSLLKLNPGVVTEGIFDAFKKVVETGLPDQSERHYVHEQFDGWFYQSAVKLNDGVATTTSNITERKKAEQQLMQLGTQQQQEIFHVSLQTLEEERRRISESLHNGLGQLLYGIKISLSGLTQQQSDTDFQKTKNYTNQLLSDAIRESRRISHELMPATLEEFGLNAALQDICEQLNGDVKFTCKVKGLKGRMERYLELAVYRTVQELTTNIIKHANATQGNVEIEILNKEIKIKVSDNGRGIENSRGLKPGIGLASIRSKIKLLNGNMEITGAKGKGTRIEITIPIQEGQKS